jgi:hypothetical protein
MSKIDYNWVKEQFAKARVQKGVGLATLDLLEHWDKMDLMEKPEFAKQVLEIFVPLSQGHAIAAPDPTYDWTQARSGAVKVGDVVRVKSDAYDGKLGAVHNGRVGVITGIRSGDIIVKTTDEQTPVLDGAHYKVTSLEKRVAKRNA